MASHPNYSGGSVTGRAAGAKNQIGCTVTPAGSRDVSMIEGTFRYQACDDKECYIPKTLQLTWMFKVGQLETDRVPLELRRSPK